MATTNRASLLSGLRTGGVRSSSISAPLSPAPAPSFNTPRSASAVNSPIFAGEDDSDHLSDLLSNKLYINGIDSPNNTFPHQHSPSHSPLNPNSLPFSPAHLAVQRQPTPTDAQLHAYQQLQLMQLEILRLQNAQAQRNQQVQAAVLADVLHHQARRTPSPLLPSSPVPTNASYDLRSNTQPARRPSQVELLRAQLGVTAFSRLDGNVPMTAALGGRFGARQPPSTVTFPSLSDTGLPTSSPPNQPSPLTGSLALGGSPSHHASKENPPSRSDAAASWRRGAATHSALNGLRTAAIASPTVKITPPPGEHLSPPLTPANKHRPRPLSFSSMAASNAIVVIDSGSEHEDAASSASSASQSNPPTPQSLTSLDAVSFSPRDEAVKKLYDGLGMGRPTPYFVQAPSASLPHRPVSQPLRQPRGPPSGSDELGPKNFATRIRRKAIDGLGVLMDARERRESIEVH